MNKRSHILFLFLCSFLWGTTFVAQRMGADHVGAFTYLAGRSWIAVVFLTPVIHFMDRFFDRRGIDNRRPRTGKDRKTLVIAGCLCGIMLFAASAAQQIGIGTTSASKAGFITALYVVLVPLLSLFLKKRPTPQIWLCVFLALAGLYLLCMKVGSFTLETGDAWVLACAFLFSIQILLLDHYSPLLDAVRLSRMQFLVVAVLSTILMFLAEHPTLGAFRLALPAILYAGIFSSGIAYTLQIVGQRYAEPAVASISMSLESVFATLGGWIIMGNALTMREFFGCALVFIAIIIAQLPEMMTKKTEGEIICPGYQEEKPL